jgi:hypothetical protein
MASIIENSPDHAHATEPAAVIDASEFEAAQRDPRLRLLIDEADSYLAELEKAGRNR